MNARSIQFRLTLWHAGLARYKVGSSSIVELSQAQLTYTSAQIATTNARYDLLMQQANLKYQIGEVSHADRLAVYSPNNN